jgi:hypothetical protein
LAEYEVREEDKCWCGWIRVPIGEGGIVDQDKEKIHFIDEPCHYVNIPEKDVKMQEIKYVEIVRRPFKVEAVEITKGNITTLARYIGDLNQNDKGELYILVDPRKVPSIKEVYVGYWMTRMGKNVRVYAPRIKKQQFMDLTPSVQEWIEFLEKEAKDNG